MKAIAIWSKLNPKTNEFEHNHIETITEFKEIGDVPTGIPEQTKAWSMQTWKREMGWIDENGIINNHKEEI